MEDDKFPVTVRMDVYENPLADENRELKKALLDAMFPLMMMTKHGALVLNFPSVLTAASEALEQARKVLEK